MIVLVLLWTIGTVRALADRDVRRFAVAFARWFGGRLLGRETRWR